MTNVLFAASSYPRSADDWQGIFIKRIVDALAESPESNLRVWAPPGPLHLRAASVLSREDSAFLERLGAQGGIAHLLRSKPAMGLLRGAQLTGRLHRAYRRNRDWADVFHINWLQCALGHLAVRKPVLVTVLGSDIALLDIPGMKLALTLALRGKRVLLCPNAQWMVPILSAALGSVCEDIVYVPFGVDDRWFRIKREAVCKPRIWVTVLRLTKQKIGPLFEWTRNTNPEHDQFHLFGPLQETLDIPPWIHYHGSVTPEALASDWYPRASGLISLSQHNEGRPQVMLDAMASGLPVIASPIPAHTDLITHHLNGLICGNPEEFELALRTLSDGAIANATSSNALRMVREQYGNWNDCARRYQLLHQRLIALPAP